MVSTTTEPWCSKSLRPRHWLSASVLPQQRHSDELNTSITAKAPPPLPSPSHLPASSWLVGVGAARVLRKWGISAFPPSVSSPAVSQDAVGAAAALLLVALALGRRLAELPRLLVDAATWGTTGSVDDNRREEETCWFVSTLNSVQHLTKRGTKCHSFTPELRVTGVSSRACFWTTLLLMSFKQKQGNHSLQHRKTH